MELDGGYELVPRTFQAHDAIPFIMVISLIRIKEGSGAREEFCQQACLECADGGMNYDKGSVVQLLHDSRHGRLYGESQKYQVLPGTGDLHLSYS
jgi:hypothetical protein